MKSQRLPPQRGRLIIARRVQRRETVKSECVTEESVSLRSQVTTSGPVRDL